MKRVINPSKYLKDIIKNGESYYIGFGINQLSELGKHHPDIKDLISGLKKGVIITGRKGALKENIAGKFVRKQPEKKTSIWKHIQYYSYKFGKQIDYDREFHIWEKELLHKYNLELRASRTPQGEILLVFPKLQKEDTEKHYSIAGAAMNMSLALGNYFMMYDTSFNPIIPVTKYDDRSLLPAGMRDKPVKEKLETIERILDSEKNIESTGNSWRFAFLKAKSPNDVTIGSGGFNEYLMFEFKESDLIVFENLKTGNATYVFRLSTFKPDVHLDKQTSIRNPGFIRRVIHENMKDWTTQMEVIL